jgi:4-hydroxyphenylacetate 3-monooxygenase
MGLRTGEQFLAGLNDSRQIIYDGRVIHEVTREPHFERTARAVAQFYDVQNLPEMRDVMTYETSEGDRAGIAFLEARSKEDIRRRAAAFAAWAEITCGFMGRSPDYMNACMAVLGAVSGPLSQFSPELGRRARDLYLQARREDLCYTHTFVEPFRVAASPGSPPVHKQWVRETPEGLRIRGARGIATLAPFCDRNLYLSDTPALLKDGEPYHCAFVLPINTPNAKWICRESFDSTDPHFSSPLSGRMDEMDCVGIFNDCLIPWEHVLLFLPTKTVAAMPFLSLLTSGLQHHVLIRCVAKTRFLAGLAHLVAESSRVNQFANVQERLGEIVLYLNTMESFAMAAVEGAVEDPSTGCFFPHPKTTVLGVWWYGKFYKKIVNILLDLGGGRHISTPQEKTMETLGESIEDYFRGTTNARDNVGLFHLAWDVIGSGWGRRQDLYERFHFGDPILRKMALYKEFDKDHAIRMVRRILEIPPDGDKIFPVPPSK